MKGLTFVDRVKVKVAAGRGGDGSASFRREKYIDRGGPDGGDGGRGGSVILRASKDASSLLDLFYQPQLRAEHGVSGRGKQMYGRNGRDLVVNVPCGTEVRLAESGEPVGEVVEEGATLQIAAGGRGGKGNCHYASPTHQAPTEFTQGQPGEEKTVVLEMKSVADIGLVGYPNAGKSTLLRALTPARPKVASYPFTTLHPAIGTLEFPDYKRLRIADIPGLIDGAHQGVGLGHDFLRHIERTSFLLFVIDMAGVDGRNPTDDYRNLRKELKKYKPELAERPSLVVANKMDEPQAEIFIKEFIRRTRQKPLRISAELEEGIPALRAVLYDRLLGSSDTPAVGAASTVAEKISALRII